MTIALSSIFPAGVCKPSWADYFQHLPHWRLVTHPRRPFHPHHIFTRSSAHPYLVDLQSIFPSIGQYDQNLCKRGDKSCVPCPERLPSCVGLEYGRWPFPGREWTDVYVQCSLNRTVSISYCNHGSVFDTQQRRCVHTIIQGESDTDENSIAVIIDVPEKYNDLLWSYVWYTCSIRCPQNAS